MGVTHCDAIFHAVAENVGDFARLIGKAENDFGDLSPFYVIDLKKEEWNIREGDDRFRHMKARGRKPAPLPPANISAFITIRKPPLGINHSIESRPLGPDEGVPHMPFLPAGRLMGAAMRREGLGFLIAGNPSFSLARGCLAGFIRCHTRNDSWDLC